MAHGQNAVLGFGQRVVIGVADAPDRALDTGFGEPHAAASWYPANDHPSDKATYQITVTAPRALTVEANGNATYGVVLTARSPGTREAIGRNSPRTSTGASGFMSQSSSWLAAP